MISNANKKGLQHTRYVSIDDYIIMQKIQWRTLFWYSECKLNKANIWVFVLWNVGSVVSTWNFCYNLVLFFSTYCLMKITKQHLKVKKDTGEKKMLNCTNNFLPICNCSLQKIHLLQSYCLYKMRLKDNNDLTENYLRRSSFN